MNKIIKQMFYLSDAQSQQVSLVNLASTTIKTPVLFGEIEY